MDNPDKFDAYVEENGIAQPFPGNVELASYALYATDRMIRFGTHILSEDKGLGKTVQALTAVIARKAYPCVFLTTKRGLRTYTKEIEKWFPKFSSYVQIVHGTKTERMQQWRQNALFYVTTYATLQSDAGRRKVGKQGVQSESILPKSIRTTTKGWVCDEFHRVLRSRSATYEFLKQIMNEPQVTTKFMLSGSALSKGPQDIWPALNILDPKVWSSYWKYVNMFCIVDDTGFGKSILGPKNTDLWCKATSRYFTDIRKWEVAKHLKPKTRLPLNWEMAPWQQILYESLLEDCYAELPDGDFVVALNKLSALHKVRMSLICPKALSPQLGVGGAIEAVASEFEESEINRFVIYTPFRDPIPHFRDFLQQRGYMVNILWGGISIDEQDQSIARWAAAEKSVMICTVKYAESFELAPYASYGAFIGHEWDKEENEQAEDRLHRLTSKDPIFIYYAQCPGTYDEDLWEHVMEKGFNVSVLLSKAPEIRAFLKGKRL